MIFYNLPSCLAVVMAPVVASRWPIVLWPTQALAHGPARLNLADVWSCGQSAGQLSWVESVWSQPKLIDRLTELRTAACCPLVTSFCWLSRSLRCPSRHKLSAVIPLRHVTLLTIKTNDVSPSLHARPCRRQRTL